MKKQLIVILVGALFLNTLVSETAHAAKGGLRQKSSHAKVKKLENTSEGATAPTEPELAPAQTETSVVPEKKADKPFRRFTLGAHGGVGFSTATFSGDDSFKTLNSGVGTRVGAVGGAQANFYFNRYIGLQGELDYVQRGIRINGKYTDESGHRSDSRLFMDLDYLEVPVFFKVRYPNWKVRPFALLGLGASFLVGKGAHIETDGNKETKTYSDEEINNTFADASIFLAAAGGAEISITDRFGLEASLRYSSLVDALNSKAASNKMEMSLQQTSLHVGANFGF